MSVWCTDAYIIHSASVSYLSVWQRLNRSKGWFPCMGFYCSCQYHVTTSLWKTYWLKLIDDHYMRVEPQRLHPSIICNYMLLVHTPCQIHFGMWLYLFFDIEKWFVSPLNIFRLKNIDGPERKPISPHFHLTSYPFWLTDGLYII